MVFYIAAGVATLIFALGVWGNISFWLSPDFSRDGSRRSRWTYAGNFLRLLFSPAGLRTFFLEVLGQRGLLRESPLRWAMSVSFAWGALELFFIGSLGNMLREYRIYPLSKDAPWFAVVNEVGGLLLLLGLSLAVLRRYVLRQPQLPSGWDDGPILLWIAVIALSGYLAEASRLLAEGSGAGLAVYSFVGYTLSLGLAPLKLSWASAEPVLWWFHAGTSLALLAYLPYSKLFHIFTAPVSLLTRTPGRSMIETQ